MKQPLSILASRLVILLGVLVFVCVVVGCGPKLAISPAKPPVELFRAVSEVDWEARLEAADARIKVAEAEARAAAAENDLKLGKEAGRASLVSAAKAVGVFGAGMATLGVLGLIAGSFAGGVGRKTCILMVLASGACVVLRFGIIVYGYAVSTAICWIAMAALVIVTLLTAFMAVQYVVRFFAARGLATKRAERGQDAADAIALLPVPTSIKGSLHDAWKYLNQSGEGDALSVSQARGLLTKFRLPLPKEPA